MSMVHGYDARLGGKVSGHSSERMGPHKEDAADKRCSLFCT